MIPIFERGLGVSLRRAFTALLLLVACAGATLGQQETGQIIGTVTDPQGALVAGATVTVRSVDTGVERTVTTGEDGNYVVTNLQPGIYEVTATGAGFQTTQAQRAQVTTGGRLTVDIGFGGVAGLQGETVEVIGGGGVEINTQDQQLSDVVSATQVRELPSLTRDPYDFVGISGNVSEANATSGQTVRGTGFNINGQRATSTNVLLDGGENFNTYFATVGQAVPLDSVQEFRVITSNFSAEYGRASGGIVNVTTRAGTNDFNGTAFIFNRISRLASNGFENNARGTERGVFTRNQFGYSVGGPVVKDKLFFFNSTEFIRVRSTGPLTAVVPTAQLLAASNARTQNFLTTYGNLAATPTGTTFTIADIIRERTTRNAAGQVINGFDPATNTFVGTFAPGVNAFTALLTGGGFGANTPAFQQVRYNVPTNLGGGLPQNTYQTVARVDYNISDRTQLYGRYALESQDFFAGTQADSPFAGFNTGSTNFNQNYLVNLTHQFTPNFISQTKLVYNRLNNFQPLGEVGFAPTLYFFPNTAATIGGDQVALPGILPFNPGLGLPGGGPQNIGQVNQDFNYTVGKQNFRFGGQYVYLQDNRFFGAFSTASETLGGQGNYATALNNFVLGQLFQFQAAVDPQGQFPGGRVTTPVGQPAFTRSNRYNEFALYANDAIRIHPRVTMNVGLRYEFYGVQRNKDPNVESNFYFGEGADIFERIRNGRVLLSSQSPVGKLWRPDYNNFAPRFGLAWDVTGDGKTSLRGGYGLAYERNFGNVTFNVIQNPPAYAVLSVTAGQDIPQDQLLVTTNNAGPLAGAGISRVLPVTSLRHVREDITNAYAHFYSLAFEREVARNTVASVEYSGSHGRDLYSIENINRLGSGLLYLGSSAPVPAGAASSTTTSRLNGQYSNINTRGNGGFSNYQALIATLDSSNFRSLGLNFTARYTYSVAKDNLSSTFSDAAANFNLGLTDPFDPRYDYGYADFDVRHRFAGSFNYEIPFFNNIENRVLRNVLGGFQLTGIFTARTGTPFTVFDCGSFVSVCLRLTPNGNVNFSGTGNSAPTGELNQFRYIDLSNQASVPFADVTGGASVGPFPTNTTARNAFRAPGFYNVDMGLYKRIRITEGTSLQLRAEVFNVLNHANLYYDSGYIDISSSDFVAARRGVTPGGTVVDRRNVQLAVKFIF